MWSEPWSEVKHNDNDLLRKMQNKSVAFLVRKNMFFPLFLFLKPRVIKRTRTLKITSSMRSSSIGWNSKVELLKNSAKYGKTWTKWRGNTEPVHTVPGFSYHLETADRPQEKPGASLGSGGGKGREAEGAILKEEEEKAYLLNFLQTSILTASSVKIRWDGGGTATHVCCMYGPLCLDCSTGAASTSLSDVLPQSGQCDALEERRTQPEDVAGKVHLGAQKNFFQILCSPTSLLRSNPPLQARIHSRSRRDGLSLNMRSKYKGSTWKLCMDITRKK